MAEEPEADVNTDAIDVDAALGCLAGDEARFSMTSDDLGW